MQRQISKEFPGNSTDTLSNRSLHNLLVSIRCSLNMSLEKQFDRLHLLAGVSFDLTTDDSSNISLRTGSQISFLFT